MVRQHCALTILQFFHSPFFQLNCHFWGERARSMISQPTDRSSPRRHYRARLRLLKQSREAKRMVRQHCTLTILQFTHSPFFQLNRHFWGERVIHGIAAHRPIFALLSLLKQKRTVRKGQEFSIFQFFNSLFFNVFAIFGANT